MTVTEDEARTLIERWMPAAEAARVLEFLDAPNDDEPPMARDHWGNPLCGECGHPGYVAEDEAGPTSGHLDTRLKRHPFLPYAG